jgi:hypothetical protein
MSHVPYVVSLDTFCISGGQHRLFVQADGPKANFPLLHRTDFRHMFLSLSDTDQKSVRWLTENKALWPESDKMFLFPFPYRGEAEAKDLDQRAPGLWSVEEDIIGGGKWTLIAHGPTISSWLARSDMTWRRRSWTGNTGIRTTRADRLAAAARWCQYVPGRWLPSGGPRGVTGISAAVCW